MTAETLSPQPDGRRRELLAFVLLTAAAGLSACGLFVLYALVLSWLSATRL